MFLYTCQERDPATIERTTTNTYDALGQLTMVVSPEGVIHYEYDSITGLNIATWTAPDESATEEDDSITDTRYAYDTLGRLDKVTPYRRNGDDITPNAEATDYVYDLLGNLDQVRLPNGVISDYDYDNLNRLVRLREFKDDGNFTYEDGVDALLAEYDYDLALDGKRSGVTEKIRVDGTLKTTRIDWLYDALGRLNYELYDGYEIPGRPSTDFIARYTLDLVGNRLKKQTDTNPTFTGTPTYDEEID